MEPVESGKSVEGPPKNSIAEGKCSASVLKILPINEQNPKPNGDCLISFHEGMLSSQHCVQCPVTAKVTPQQQQCVGQGLMQPVNRHNPHRRPTHTNLNCGHQCSVLEPPHETCEKCPFTQNEQHHSSFLSGFYQRGVASRNAFARNVTPPAGCCKQQKKKSQKPDCRCTGVLMKHQYSATQKPLECKPGLNRPGTKIYQMVPVCGHSGSGLVTVLRRVGGARYGAILNESIFIHGL